MPNKQKTYLVTGGAGFIGSHLVEALIYQGFSVRVLDNFSTGKYANLAHIPAERLHIMAGDISDEKTVWLASENIAGIFHLAALVSVPASITQPRQSFNDNAKGTFNLYEAARLRQIPRMVQASSAAVYGDNPHLPLSEEATLKPLSPYALDKLYGEYLAATYFRCYRISATALRFFNVYGERQDPNSPYSGVISHFNKRLAQGEKVTIYGDGAQTRDFVYVKDVVNALLQAMRQTTQAVQVFNVGTGKTTSINQLYALLQEQTHHFTPAEHQASRAGDIVHSCASIEKIQRELNWTAQWCLADGLKRLETHDICMG
jgi:nucleoside-diphosphate-sugar epimerase